MTASQVSLLNAHAQAEKDLGLWSPLVGILLAFALYYRGLGIADGLLKLPPVRWIRTFLYDRMYFDELYFGVLVSTVTAGAALAAWIERALIDRIVNGAGTLVRQSAAIATVIDHRLLDGAVTGVGALANQFGDAARATQSGRIRGYVTALLTVAALAIAVAVIVALSK